MHTWLATGLMGRVIRSRRTLALVAVLAVLTFALPVAFAQQGQAAPPTSQVAAVVSPQPGSATQETAPATPAPEATGEANLKLPDMDSVKFLNGTSGRTLLEIGLIFCAFGGLFGLIIYMQLKNAPVHRSMREISELIYETCKTYLVTQGKFILILEAFIAVVIVLYFGVLEHLAANRVDHHSAVQPGGNRGQLRCGVVRYSHQYFRQLAHGIRRTQRQTVSDLRHSAEGGHEHWHDVDQRRIADHALHSALRPRRITRAPASSDLRSVNRWAQPRCVLPVASSPRLPISALT